LFGSRIYGNFNKNSDYDYIAIGDKIKYQEVIKGYINIHLFNERLFRSNLDDYDMRAIECVLAPQFAKLKESIKFNVKIKPKTFRDSLYFQIDKNWRVGKKKFSESNIYGGKKRIYHSLRLLLFGIQLLESGKISNWSVANQFHQEISTDKHSDWDYYRTKY
jgi:predicted nucleotidyltransferase